MYVPRIQRVVTRGLVAPGAIRGPIGAPRGRIGTIRRLVHADAGSAAQNSRGLAKDLAVEPVTPWYATAWARSAGVTGAVALVIYTVPMFKETREGFYVGLHYPYDLLFKDSLGEGAWKGVVAVSGVGAGAFSVRALTGTISVLPNLLRTALSAFTGVLTGMLCYEQSHLIVRAAQRASKIISYTVDGFVADVSGRGPERPIWERRDGLTYAAIKGLHETQSSQRAAQLAQPDHEFTVEKVDKMNLDQVVNALSTHPDDVSVRARLLAHHKELLVKEINEIRQEETLFAKSGNTLHKLSAKDSDTSTLDVVEEVKQGLNTLKKRKSALKAECLRVHNTPLREVSEERLKVSIDKLSELRKTQYELAKLSNAVSAVRRLQIRDQIRQMDGEKARLKRAGKEVFGTNISPKAITIKPWRQVVSSELE
mmetsp:Transcript_22213/g.41668  ORF Transcript_22213/g.41668 Transcript_22213/m.41668 type:complete len:425 (-) Transcript_22213:49-1323(-)